MADWTDGAEYAPVERPTGFATPRVGALQVVEAPPSPADGQPTEAPGSYQAPSTTPLEALDPREVQPRRDPQEPFASHGSADSAWGAVHGPSGWEPTMPLGSPQPEPEATSVDFPPPQGAPVAPGPAGLPTPQSTAQPPSARGPEVVAIPLQGQFPPPSGAPAPLPPPTGALPQPTTPTPAPPQGFPPPQQVGQPQQPVAQRPANPFAPAPKPGQQPAPWPAQQPSQPAPRPTPTRLTPTTVVSETGPLVLAVLAFGALIPGLGTIMLVIASILSRRQNPTNVMLRALYNVAIWAILLSWLARTILSPETSAWPGNLGRWLCLVMIPASLAAVHDERRKRIGR